jgi:hypothetical protein
LSRRSLARQGGDFDFLDIPSPTAAASCHRPLKMWGRHSCPPTADTRTTSSKTTDQKATPCLWANCPRRSKATTQDSLLASGWGAPEPGCARSEATTAAQRRLPAAFLVSFTEECTEQRRRAARRPPNRSFEAKSKAATPLRSLQGGNHRHISC